MSNLSALRAELARLERELESLEKEKEEQEALLKKAKKRIEGIRPILRSLQNDFDGNCKSINIKMDALENDLRDGLKGINLDSLSSDISESNEKEPEGDSELSQSITKLQEEIDALEDYAEERKIKIGQLIVKIGDKRIEIAKIKVQIQHEEAMEALENIGTLFGF